jgi:hypothetical protein
VDSKRNYFFNSKSTARIHLKTDNKLSWTYLFQQRGPHTKPWRAGCGPRAVVWAALTKGKQIYKIFLKRKVKVKLQNRNQDRYESK